MKRMMALAGIGLIGLIGASILPAVAEPTTDTRGCQVVASKFLQADAPGHQGIQNAGGQAAGEGPCGFGDPPQTTMTG